MVDWWGEGGDGSYKITLNSVISREINGWPQVCNSNFYLQTINIFLELYELV